MKGFKVFPEIRHINIRKEGEEREVLAIDVKMQASVQASLIDQLMCEGINDGDAIRCFWNENEEGAPRFLGVPGIAFQRTFKNVTTNMIGMEFSGCSISKFGFTPKAQRQATLTFSVTLQEPPSTAADKLASMLGEAVEVEFFMTQLDMIEEAGKDDASKAGE